MLFKKSLVAAAVSATPALAHYKDYPVNTYWGQNGKQSSVLLVAASCSIYHLGTPPFRGPIALSGCPRPRV